MYTIAALGLIAFLLGLVLTPLCRNLALRYNLVDKPDKQRKLHAKPTPRVGGVAIVLAYAGSIGLVLLFTPEGARLHIQHGELLKSLLPSAVIIFLTGLLDDLIGLRPRYKLCGQVLGAGMAIVLGMHFSPNSFPIAANHPFLAHHWIAIPVALVWLVGCTNAVNLIDGLDGLASGVGLFAAVATLLAGVFSGRGGLVLATMPLVGALLAFLYYNFNPASIFLGDSGSLTIGFMLGVFSLVWSESSTSVLGIAAPFMVLALPLIDVVLAICRRYLRRVPIFSADRGHIHHIVQSKGFKPRETALILYAVCAVAASLALLQSLNIHYLRYAVLVVFVALVWAGLRYLNYVELVSARRFFSRSHLRRIVRDDVYLHELDRTLATMESLEDCWAQTCRVCADLHFVKAEMYFQERYFEASLSKDAPDHEWQMTLPLGERGYLRLSRSSEDPPPQMMFQALSHVRRAFAAREHKLARPVYQFADAA